MKIHIDALELYCIIGLMDFERESEQKILLDMTIRYTYKEGSFLDYSKVADQIEQHLKKEKYLLLEEALNGIKVLLFKHYPVIEKLKLKLSKPDILPHCSVGVSEAWSRGDS